MQTTLNVQADHSGRIYLRQRDLLSHYLPFSATTLWRKVKAGEFPAPIKLGPSITAWKATDVHAWLDARDISCRG